MAGVTRKQIAAALLAQLTNGGPFVKIGRRLTDPESAAAPNEPALFLIKVNEDYTRDERGTPAVRKLQFHAIIYTDIGADVNGVPADVIDDVLDQIDQALAPNFVDQTTNQGRQTLGGLVYDCRIIGELDIAPGDVQGKGETVIPIEVIIP